MGDAAWLEPLDGLSARLLARIRESAAESRWIRESSGTDLLEMATESLGLRPIPSPFADVSAVEVGDLPHHELVASLREVFDPGTSLADEVADQIQLCRAFADPAAVTHRVEEQVTTALDRFPREASDLKLGHNPGDVLDPFILAAHHELLSQGNLLQTIETTAAHKILMKIEDLAGNLHQNTVAAMRGNFRVPEPGGARGTDKERLDPVHNPFPGADVGQVPTEARPDALRLFQVKSKTGSAKGGDGKRLGEQLAVLEDTYGAETFYVAVVGNTLRGHRSKGAVLRASPRTAVLVGQAALRELTQSDEGGELLLRTYQRAFRRAARAADYDFAAIVAAMAEVFAREAEEMGDDFLTAWLHEAIDGPASSQDSREAS